MPRTARLEAPEQNLGPSTITTTDPITVTDKEVLGGDVHETTTGVEVVEGPAAMARAEELAFNEEMVTIVIHDSTNPNDENPVRVAVNGRAVFVYRNTPTIVKRYYVERLARAKQNRVTQKKRLDDEGNESYSETRTPALKYGFAVEQDTQKGRDWLRKILAEPA